MKMEIKKIDDVIVSVNNNECTLTIPTTMDGVRLNDWKIKNDKELQKFKEVNIKDYVKPVIMHKDNILTNDSRRNIQNKNKIWHT